MTGTDSHYDTLGVSEDASQEEIKNAFFELVREHPPEQDPDAYQRLREAYDVLSDPVSRREYDTMAQHGDEIESLQEEAEVLLNQEAPAPKEAIKKLRRATVLGPDISLLRNMLGRAYLMDEQPEKALTQFDKAVGLNPDNDAHHLNRGYALRELERLREAEAAFRTVWDDDSGNYAAARGVAGALADRERYQEAHEVLDEAIWADDVLDFEDFFCYYDKLYLYLAQQETDALERALDTVVDMAERPDDRQYAAFMLVQLADDLHANGAFGLAHRFGEAAKELDERSVDPEVVEQVGELRDLEEQVETIMDADRYHKAVQQMVAIYYDQLAGAMSERQAEEATENIVRGLDNLMQADPDHTEIKRSLRHIRSRHPKAFDLNPEFFEAILDVPDAELFVDDCPHCAGSVMAEKGFSGEMQCPHCTRSVYSDGGDYYTSRSASKQQSSMGGQLNSTKSRNSESRGRTRETTGKKKRTQARGATRESKAATPTNHQSILATIASEIGEILKGLGDAFLKVVLPALLGIGLIPVVVIMVAEVADDGPSENSGAQTENASSPPTVERNTRGTDTEKSDQQAGQSFSGEPKSLPENGTWWEYTSERQIAPLRISVSSGEHYYIKVVDAYTEARVLTLFIRSGRTAQVDVPLGTYRLKYAVGDTWYGREDRFGSETRYFEAEDTFDFEVVGNQVRGHRIELILQEGGNLTTESIPEGKF